MRRLLTLLLLPLWFAASVHCGLEALRELYAHQGCSGNLCSDKGDCDRDACDLLEDGDYRNESGELGMGKPSMVTGPGEPADAPVWSCPLDATPAVWKPPVLYQPLPRRPAPLELRAVAWPGAPGLGFA